jgi:site-specific DNA-methyltransferase (adenine-specific)
MKPYYEHAGITIYHGDSAALVPDLIPECAVVSDPPYGMKWNTNMTRFSGGSGGLERASRGRDWPRIKNDDAPFDPSSLIEAPSCLLFGVNHFAQRVPVGTWLIWLKKPAARYGAFLSDAEVAWMKGGHGIYAREFQWEGLNRAEERGQHYHPTQKPVSIMRWCIEMSAKNDLPILDPFMGSGTTLVAAKHLGRRAIGIELEERYCEIAARRLSQEVLELGA